jgi:ABC-type phosphate transport system substrate-binding protein
MVSRSITIASSGGRAKAALYREASAYCAKRGLVMVPVATDAIEPAYGQHMGNAELTFRALKPGDLDIRRTNVESPDHTQRIQMR